MSASTATQTYFPTATVFSFFVFLFLSPLIVLFSTRTRVGNAQRLNIPPWQGARLCFLLFQTQVGSEGFLSGRANFGGVLLASIRSAAENLPCVATRNSLAAVVETSHTLRERPAVASVRGVEADSCGEGAEPLSRGSLAQSRAVGGNK